MLTPLGHPRAAVAALLREENMCSTLEANEMWPPRSEGSRIQLVVQDTRRPRYLLLYVPAPENYVFGSSACLGLLGFATLCCSFVSAWTCGAVGGDVSVGVVAFSLPFWGVIFALLKTALQLGFESWFLEMDDNSFALEISTPFFIRLAHLGPLRDLTMLPYFAPSETGAEALGIHFEVGIDEVWTIGGLLSHHELDFLEKSLQGFVRKVAPKVPFPQRSRLRG